MSLPIIAPIHTPDEAPVPSSRGLTAARRVVAAALWPQSARDSVSPAVWTARVAWAVVVWSIAITLAYLLGALGYRISWY